jgi:hypothetical protein
VAAKKNKNGEKIPGFDGVTVVLLTIFSINFLLLIRMHDLGY